MNTTRARIGVVAGCLGAGFCVVLLHLWFVMVQRHEDWARRSRENRWAFRSVPSQRGALLDRHGRSLAFDEPAMELSLHYQRFRLRHPVGAAVHGATLWASLRPGLAGTRYSYHDGALGPLAAVEDLLAMPARMLQPGVLPKTLAAELGTTVTTVLAACSGLPRRNVFAALRATAAVAGPVACGDVLPAARPQLLAAFRQNLASLRHFDADLTALQQHRRRLGGLPPDASPSLFDQLDARRRDSLEQRRVRWQETGEDGVAVEREGSLVESIRTVVDEQVPFEFAARLRVGAEQHPGLEVHPSIRRVIVPAPGSVLRVLLGRVENIGRSQPDAAWVDRLLARSMPADWLDAFAPEALADSAADRERLQQEARESYEAALLRQERRGVGGLERAFDDALMGRLGLRWVERDARRRERRLWSHLRVEAGDAVRVSLDVDLQQLAETVVADARARMAAAHADGADQAKVEAALAVVDARSGDVLAFAGAPVASPYAPMLPGLVWSKDGSLGSVVKPLVLVEQLEREALGRPHRPFVTFDPCAGKYVFGHQRLGCSRAHGDSGRDPVDAVAQSCNTFFFQCAEGLGAEGVLQALRRFGLCRPASANDPFAACWQASAPGLPMVAPRVSTAQAVPMRAVGYGVEASPLAVARAYAALATGRLPTLGLAAGVARPQVDLAGVAAELAVVREGLRGCVERGTARTIPLLRQFAVLGKTGTAEVGEQDQNNAWFAGFLDGAGADGVQICFCAVVYWVPHGVHGDEAAGRLVAQWLAGVEAEPALAARYLPPEVRR
ncbi:MAG: hypothetical protein KF830_09220 [Planctomycetes bacterium]|nr:hypothetical protein [Planctomycetota bacterium]